MTWTWTWSLTASVVVAWAISIWFKYQKALARVHHLPGARLLFNPYSPVLYVLPRIKWVSVGTQYGWEFKRSLYDGSKWDVHTLVGILNGTPGYMVASADAFKQVLGARSPFVKRVEDFSAMRVFGPNLVGTEGEQWKRHRRICAPAFSDRNNRFVWSTAAGLANEMMATWSKDEPTKVVNVCDNLTIPFALGVIAKAGFGQDITWADDAPPPPNHKLTFKKSMSVVARNIYLPMVLADWAWSLRKEWRDVKEAYDENLLYLNEMIDQRRNTYETPVSSIHERVDLFSQLLNAYDANDQFTPNELIGNVFGFLIAGHETTSHTLGFLFGLLALHPEEQDKLLQQIEQNHPQSREFGYEDMQKLGYVVATLYETLRLYPSVIHIPRVTSENTHLNIGSNRSVTIPQNTRVGLDSVGLHYNPQYWDNPHEFSPSRFLDPNWNRDAFVAFSFGPRSCIGRRFAETTVVALLVTLLPKYKISLNQEFKEIPGESTAERRERFMNARSWFTLAPGKISLTFTPRL